MHEMTSADLKSSVRHLWELCFRDTPEFIDLYFRLRYRDALNEAILRDGQVVSALQLIPYELQTWGARLPLAYLSGVCTHPQARRQGLMRRLLKQTHRRLYAEGCPVSSLIPAEPWLFDCYATSGYAPLFVYDWRRLSIAPGDDTVTVSEYREDSRDVYAYFSRKMSERPCCVLHSEEDFGVVLADLYLSEGSLWVARRDGTVTGLAFCVPTPDICRIGECLADTPAVARTLVNRACEHTFMQEAECLHPVAPDEAGRPLGMLRIIRVADVLALHARTHPDAEACWRITDPDIPENNVCIRLSQGTATPAAPDEGIPTGIGELAARLWSDERPYMSLMLN